MTLSREHIASILDEARDEKNSGMWILTSHVVTLASLALAHSSPPSDDEERARQFALMALCAVQTSHDVLHPNMLKDIQFAIDALRALAASPAAAPTAEHISDDELAATDPNVCEHGWLKTHPQPCPECAAPTAEEKP
jgi:hypothetical protein